MTNFRHLGAVLLAASLAGGCATRPSAPVDIHLVALNDFHGHLEPSKFEYKQAGVAQRIDAGGIDTIAAALQAWRKEQPDLLFVGAGDLIGASPAMSQMWADEPTLQALSMAGLRASAVGNHEFDQGRAELLRQQRGGCESVRPDKACKFAPDFSGAGFTYLAANVIDNATGKPFLPAYTIEQVKGVKVGLIGAVLKDTASVVWPTGIAGLTFTDEADAINAVIPHLRAAGARVFVLMIHEGGHTTEAFDQPDCSKLAGPIVGIVKRLDPAIRLIISGHTHAGFMCKVDGRVVTQAEMGGHVLTRIKMQVDPHSGAVADIGVSNVVMKAGQYPPDSRVADYLTQTRARSAAALARPLARVAVRSINRQANAAGETALGDLVADAVLAGTREQGAQLAFMNAGGLRRDFDVASLTANYGQLQGVLPFGNTLVLMDLTGAQLYALLEQQWVRPGTREDSTLQVSKGFTYRWNPAAPRGSRVVGGSVMLDGKPVEPARTYRVAANNFLAEGGDNFPAFKSATNKLDTRLRDIDLVEAYLIQRERAGVPAGSATPDNRIQIVKETTP